MREKIVEVLQQNYIDVYVVADKILALFPANETGLVHVRGCDKGVKSSRWYGDHDRPNIGSIKLHDKDCACHGTGTIREKVSESEAVEILKQAVPTYWIYDKDGNRIELTKE